MLLAAVSIWRLWPISLFARPLAACCGATRAAFAAALVALWLALIDAATLLLLTGGQPFNATHVWASWAFHTVWVSRLWGYGAVMLGGLAAASALISGLVFYLAAHTPNPQGTAALHTAGRSYVGCIGAVLALAPLTLHMPSLNVAELDGALAGLISLGFVCAGQSARRHAAAPAAIVSALLVLNHFTAEIVLEGSRRAYPLGAGMALYLAENPTLAGERAWALLLTLGLARIAAYAAGRFCNERRAW